MQVAVRARKRGGVGRGGGGGGMQSVGVCVRPIAERACCAHVYGIVRMCDANVTQRLVRERDCRLGGSGHTAGRWSSRRARNVARFVVRVGGVLGRLAAAPHQQCV